MTNTMARAVRFVSFATLAVLAGCSPRSGSLARVGNGSISVDEFVEIAGRSGPMYAAAGDSGKRQLLNDLVQRSLMLEAARHEPWAQESELKDLRARTEKEILSGAIVERLVPRTVPVSDGEARMLYERRAQEAHLLLICTFDERLIRGAMTELSRGASFASVAERFNVPGLLPAGGDLGFIAPGSLPSPVDEWLTDAPIGKLVGPVHGADLAWYIALIQERRPRMRDSFEAERATLVQTLGQRKRRRISIDAFEKLRETYELRVEPGAAQFLFARYNHAPEDTSDTQDPTTVLARYRDENGREATYKLRDALDDLDSGTGNPPDPNQLPSFEQWIESRVMQRLLLIEAHRRRLQDEPAVARRIRDRIDNYLLNTVYQSHVSDRVQATPEDLALAYQRQAPALARMTSAHVQYITLPDSAVAVRTLEHARGSKTLSDAFLLTSSGMSVREETIPFPNSNPEWAAIEQGLQRMPPGAYGGPVRVAAGWRVIQMISAERDVPPLEKLSEESQQTVRMEAESMARERRLAQYTDSLRHAIPVTIDRERLARVPWPVPPGPSG